MPHAETDATLADLIRQLDQAVDHADPHRVCEEIKQVLCSVLCSSSQFLPESFTQPSSECYARHLVHKDPAGRYSVVAMVWDSGQCTPLHDHAGCWCVEGVYQGEIAVTSYKLEQHEGDDYRFSEQDKVTAGRGECGALIPPFEYHIIENPNSTTAVTIHVYAGELTQCHIFLPDEESGAFRRTQRQLSYS